MTEQEKQPRYFYVGQEVWTIEFKKGVVASIGNHPETPVNVNFNNGSKGCYAYDGRLNFDGEIVLSQRPIHEKIVNEPLPDFKHGDLVLVRPNHNALPLLRFFKEFDPKPNNSAFVCYSYGATPSQFSMLERWSYCEKYNPEKHHP